MKTYRSWRFWLVIALFTLCTFLQYVEQIGIGNSPSLHFGLTRHALDRILFLIPVIYSGFVFGLVAGLATCASAFIVMLPRAVAISPAPEDAVLESVAVTVVGAMVCTGLWLRLREKEQLRTALKSLESAHMEVARLLEEERETASRLAVSQKKYRELFEGANDAIWICDLKRNVIAANRATEKLTGYSLRELGQMNMKEFLSEGSLKDLDRVESSLAKELSPAQPYEGRLIRKDGTEGILMLSTSVLAENGRATGFQHLARDVTEERRMQQNLQHYLSQITRAQEEERLRIARELHDDTIQALYALSREVDSFLRRSGFLDPEGMAWLRRLHQQLIDASEGVRRTSQSLRPPMLDDLGLAAAVRWLVREMQHTMQVEVVFTVSGSERRLAPEVELGLFRVIQEALTNVWKHAQATKCNVGIEFDETRICISIGDNGRGFVPSDIMGSAVRPGTLGLAGMEERMRLLGGRLQVLTEPGIGTMLIVEVPMRQA